MAKSEISDAELAVIEAAIESALPTEREHFNAKATPELVGLMIQEIRNARRVRDVLLAAENGLTIDCLEALDKALQIFRESEGGK